MKLDIENEIRKYVKENAGTTENKIVDYLTQKRISSRKTTLRIIDSLKGRKIIHDRKEANSFHQLYINDVSTFSRIEKELKDIEPLIKRTNQYFTERLEENRKDVKLSDSDDEDKRTKYEKRAYLTLEQERTYKLTAHRMLDDLYQITTTSDLSRQDSERFIKKIIELKTMLAYHEWSIDVEKSFFKLQAANLRTYESHIKQAGLEDYFEERHLKGKLLDPLKVRIEKFQQFLANANQI